MPTPHISAQPGEIADLVIMPGDPKRAERIARTRMDGARLVSDVRGITAWTGSVDGVPMTAMASGMGVPSISIYATELYTHYGVKRICRVGTCGGIASRVAVADVVIAASAHTNSAAATIDIPGVSLSLAASFDMLRAAADQACGGDSQVHIGAVYTSDFFYSSRSDIIPALDRLGALAVEMEAAGLYGCAMSNGGEALAVLTVSDHLFDGSADLTATERETMFEGSLEAAVAALKA